MYTAIQSAIAVDFTLYKIKLLLLIASPDTNVFLVMIQMYASLPCNISFLTGKGNLKRSIPVQPVYTKLGHRRASARHCTWLPRSNRIGHMDDLQGDPNNGASKCLWHVTMTYLMLWNR